MTPSGYPHGTTVAADDAPATGAAADAGTTTSAAPAFSKPLPLTRPPVIAGLVAAILLFAVGIAVAATTQVQAREQGDGMVIPGGTFIPVVSPVAGQVRTPPVVSRTMLAPGAPVAEVVAANGAQTPIVAPAAGALVAAWTVVGEVVEAGQTIAQLANTTEPLQVTAFYPVKAAGSIRVGMPAQVYTIDSNVNSASYTEAKVASVGEFVATDQAIATIVGSPALVSEITKDGPVVVVALSFPGNPTDAEQLTWSGARPPHFGTGAVVKTAVVTGSQSVLSLVWSS